MPRSQGPHKFLRLKRYTKPRDFNWEAGKPLDFEQYLRFSHFALEKQLVDSTDFFPNRNKLIKKNRAKYNRVWSADPTDDSFAYSAVRMHFGETMDLVKDRLFPELRRQVHRLPVDFDVPNYFLDSMISGRLEARRLVDQKSIQINRDNLFVEKYRRRRQLPEGSRLVDDVVKFYPMVLWKERGGQEVKEKIEGKADERVVGRLDILWRVGAALSKINDRVGGSLDSKDGPKLGGKEYVAEYMRSKELLCSSDPKLLRDFEESVIGKKFLEKSRFVRECVQKVRAEQFVDRVQMQTSSRRVGN